MEKVDVVKHILRNTSHNNFVRSSGGFAWAPSNVALVKYWGKRDSELNLPATSSLSLSLGNKGTATLIKQTTDPERYTLNGDFIAPSSQFAVRLKKFLDLFRFAKENYLVEIDTNVPIASGFASSACGFASLVQALNNLYDWRLSKKDLSILARLGSGSACRSVAEGFVEWQKGDDYNGMDSFGVKLDFVWPELRVGLLAISLAEKEISSREAMAISVNSSPLYAAWPKQVDDDLARIKFFLERKDFKLLGETAESNSLSMHSIMNASIPSVNYSLPETLAAMLKVQELRKMGLPVYFTQDAGANLQLLFLAEHEEEVLRSFPDLEVVLPFVDSNSEQIVLVNEDDVEVGTAEKLAAHVKGELHRAFSVVILRETNGSLEVLLQKRSATKYHSANLWSNTCCSHPRPGEDIIDAGERRLAEEMGFSVPLKEVGKFHYMAKFSDVGLIENEIDHVLVGFSDIDEVNFDPNEVQDYCWVDINKLMKNLQSNPDQYTVWFPRVVDLLVGYIG